MTDGSTVETEVEHLHFLTRKFVGHEAALLGEHPGNVLGGCSLPQSHGATHDAQLAQGNFVLGRNKSASSHHKLVDQGDFQSLVSSEPGSAEERVDGCLMR